MALKFAGMKRNNWIPGLVLSLAIALIGSFPRFLRAEVVSWQLAAVTMLYTFLFCTGTWLWLSVTMPRFVLPGAGLKRFWRGGLVIVIAGASGLAYHYLFSVLIASPAQITELPGYRRVALVTLRSLVISGFFYFVIYYLYMISEKQKSYLELEKLKQAQLQADISSLKEQLSPHFLFNTLNTLSTLTREPEVKDFIVQLSNVYRYVLQCKELNTVMLARELEFVGSYSYILKSRLEDAISITFDVSNNVLGAGVPPLALQLLIENAVKHNIASAARPLMISIKDEDGYLVVKNNLQPRSSVMPSSGTGLNNIMQRYKLIFGRSVFVSSDESSFTVKLPIV